MSFEVTAVTAEGLRRWTRAGRRVAAPASAARLDASADGSWPRHQDEIGRQLDQLRDVLAPVQAGTVRAREQFAIGVREAARWTLGTSARPPMPIQLAEVSNATVSICLGCARAVSREPDAAGWYARGVAAWLEWLTGARDDIPYPPG